MKCKNCGANYSSRDLQCPYCDTPNPRGVLWYHQRTQAQSDYEKGLLLLPLLRRVAINRILNRVLIAEALILCLLLAGIFAFFAVEDLAGTVSLQWNRQAIQTELDVLYEQQRYGELYSRMQDADMMDEENYAYTQMALLYNDYESFVLRRMEYFSQLDGEGLESYTLESLIRSIHNVMVPYVPAYSDLTEENRRQMEIYAQETADFAQSVLGFGSEEMKLLEEDYLDSGIMDRLLAAAKEGDRS